jgi:hypothetical protein
LSTLGDTIAELRGKGMSYKGIAKAIPCSLGTVSYFLSEGQKEKTVARNRKRRRAISARIKEEYGGCCAVCGYNKCISALEFDHLDPKKKSFAVSSGRNHMPSALKEAEKCILLCANHHRERHAGLLDIGAYLEPDL